MLIAREDRQLRLADAIALRLHMLACEECPDFEQQVANMRSAMMAWRQYTDEES